MTDFILMTKGEEEKLVHPGNVENHERFGWVRVKHVMQPPQTATVESLPPGKSETLIERKAREKAEREAEKAAKTNDQNGEELEVSSQEEPEAPSEDNA